MNRLYRELEPATVRELVRVVEPLASYICATERPVAALRSAMALLMDEIDLTCKAAHAQISHLSGDARP